MRSPRKSLAILVVMLATLACPVRAGWEAPGGALVTPVGARTQPLLVIADGAAGVFVVLGGAGIAVQHLDAAGDVVAGWPAAGAQVSSTVTLTGSPCSPAEFAAVSAAVDGAGGVFITWGGPPILANTTFPTLYVQHVGANGQLASGWPASGLAATTSAGQGSALAYPDGSGGVFVLWHDRRRLLSDEDDPHIMLQHFLGNGARAPSFAAIGRFLGANLPPVPAPRVAAVFAADPAGGAWALVTRASSDTTLSPSGFVIMRIDADGLVANGWGEDGLMLPGPSADVGHPDTHDARVFPDGSGGAWAFIASGARGQPIAFHQLADGSLDAMLPAEGLALAVASDQRVDPDGVGGFFARVEGVGSYPHALALQRLEPDGSVDPAWETPLRLTGPVDAQLFPTPDGVLGAGWLESSSIHCDTNGGDVLVGRLRRDGTIPPDWPTVQGGAWGIAAAMDVSPSTLEFPSAACADGIGGYVVCWQTGPLEASHEARAMRYTLHGPVAGVGSQAHGALAMRGPRFSRAGIRVSVAGVSAGGARLDVHDLLGRRLTSWDVAATAGTVDVTIPGTRGLPSGLYFLRLRATAGDVHAKVLVSR